MKYNIEISGSIPVHRKTNTHLGLKRIANQALGCISVVRDGKEVFFGSKENLITVLKITEENGQEL